MLPRKAFASDAPCGPLVKSRNVAVFPFKVKIVSKQAAMYETPKSRWLPVGPLKSSSVNKLSSRRFSFGSKGNAFVAIVSQMIGENSVFMQALVKVPAIEENVVSSFVYKIQRRKSAFPSGT